MPHERETSANIAMRRINNQLMQGNATQDGTYDDSDSMSTLNSNGSILSSISNLSTKTGYTVRHERRVDLYHYIKDRTYAYRHDLYYHAILASIWFIVSLLVDTSCVHSLIVLLLSVSASVYLVLTSVMLYYVIHVRRVRHIDDMNEFRSNCISLATKNAVLMQEYIDVYDYRLTKEAKNRQNADGENTVYVSQDDGDFVPLTPTQFKEIIVRIHSHIRLSTELANLKSDDTLELKYNGVYCNASQGALVERNREIEHAINRLDKPKRSDIINSWNSVDRRHDMTIIALPYRWITYEYRNLFRYLHSTTYLREIYANLGQDFMSFQQCVDSVNSSAQRLYSKNEYASSDEISTLHSKIYDILVSCIDVYIALCVAYQIYGSYGILNAIVNSVIGITLGCAVQIIIIAICSMIQKIIKMENNEINVKHVMDQIKMLCC